MREEKKCLALRKKQNKLKKCLVILPLNEKQKQKQHYLLRFMSLFSPVFEVIKKNDRSIINSAFFFTSSSFLSTETGVGVYLKKKKWGGGD